LGGSDFQGASLEEAELQSASVDKAKLQGASLRLAQLQGASLEDAQLQGVLLNSAQLQGASLDRALLQGADLGDAQLQGASLRNAQLQGASLRNTKLQGAALDGAGLQGASPYVAQFQGASLSGAQLQGADFFAANLDHLVLADVWTWRANIGTCTAARVTDHKTDNVVAVYRQSGLIREQIPAKLDTINKFIEHSVAAIPDGSLRERVADQMRKRLVVEQVADDTDDLAKVWSGCEEAGTKIPQKKFDEERAALLRNLACDASENRDAIAAGIIRNWVLPIQRIDRIAIFNLDDKPSVLSVQLARGLLGQDGKACAARKDFDEDTLSKLRAVVAKAVPVAAPAK
jgi:hypothetical protein